MLYLWTLPMNVLGWLLVKINGCTQDPITGDWFAPANSWLDDWILEKGFSAITLSQNYIVFRHDVTPTIAMYKHEFIHVEQHCKYGPFFLLVYGWYSLLSYLQGTGWYKGNKLEREARGER